METKNIKGILSKVWGVIGRSLLETNNPNDFINDIWLNVWGVIVFSPHHTAELEPEALSKLIWEVDAEFPWICRHSYKPSIGWMDKVKIIEQGSWRDYKFRFIPGDHTLFPKNLLAYSMYLKKLRTEIALRDPPNVGRVEVSMIAEKHMNFNWTPTARRANQIIVAAEERRLKKLREGHTE